MAVRPPDGGGSEPDAIEFGIAALDARLDGADVEFPATRAELQSSLGDESIPYDASGHTVRFGEVLTEAGEERYDSESDLLERVHPIFERHREQRSNSLVGRLRSLLPF
jgi:hypothetical protein